MAISIDQVPVDWAATNQDRWVFQLSEQLNGHHGGALFVDGQTLDAVDGRTFKRFVVSMGHVMVGALRVHGGELELGDVAALKPSTPAKPPPVAEAKPAHAERPATLPPLAHDHDKEFTPQPLRGLSKSKPK